MLQNAYLLAKIGADTAENEQHFAENLPIGRRVADVSKRISETDRREAAAARLAPLNSFRSLLHRIAILPEEF